jgi:hypothetical protein
MGKKRDFLGKSVLFVIVAIAMILAACANEGEEESEWSPNIGYPSSLTEDQWYEGDVPSYSGGEQWFKFTATASTQYIHVSFRTLDGLYMRIYNSNGSSVDGSWAENSTGSYYNGSIRKDSPTYSITTSLTSGKTYYIRVWPYASYNQSTSGYYRIAFNKSNNPPVSINGTWTPNYYGTTQLTVNQWANGNVSSSSDGGQWFKFTANASTQYIHVSLDTYDSLYVQLYDSHGYSVGSQTKMDSSTRYTSKSLTSGQTYYINVTPYSSSSYGSVSYKIAFNTSSTLPAGGTHDIDSSLYGTWSTSNNSLTVTFSADGVTWGGTLGTALNHDDAVWTAKDGAIKYTWNGTTTTAYNYTIEGGNLKLSDVNGLTTLTLTKQ